jgi:hypothetical protein
LTSSNLPSRGTKVVIMASTRGAAALHRHRYVVPVPPASSTIGQDHAVDGDEGGVARTNRAPSLP